MRNISKAQEAYKQAAAYSAINFIQNGMVVGVGTGSTVSYFITALSSIKHKIEGAVASSVATAKQLVSLGIPIIDLNSVDEISLYIDSADEINLDKQMLKGAGGALTGEKIIATLAQKWICIVSQEKLVERLGVASCPVAIEVIPMARSYVARQLVKWGADPVYRQGAVTDYGNVILDTYHLLSLSSPMKCEKELNHIVGVVENGIFAQRSADIILLGTARGVEQH